MPSPSLEILSRRTGSEAQARAEFSTPCKAMPPKPGTRIISVATDSTCAELVISAEDARKLLDDELLFECEELHDLHLQATRLFTSDDVERLLVAVDRQARSGERV